MAIDAKRNAISLFFKLALADGVIVDSEKELLEECIQEFGLHLDFATLCEESADQSIESLCAGIESPNDRFFIRVRCHLMVKIDGEIDTKEQVMLDRILSLLPLNGELESLLDTVLDFESGQNVEPDFEAIESLYQDSSFSLEA